MKTPSFAVIVEKKENNMATCQNCGKENKDGLNFCIFCGNAIIKHLISKNSKCPNCGSEVSSFDLKCAYCGHEFQTAINTSAVNVLADKINQLELQRNTHHYKNMVKYGKKDEVNTIEKQKIELIKNFIIPNTKQDIYEFMILAITNFDLEYYRTHIDEEDITDAWLVKIEQCYQKANLLLDGSDRAKIIDLYNNIKPGIEKAKNFKQEELKRKKEQKIKKIALFSILGILASVFIFVILPLLIEPIYIFLILILIGFIAMILSANRNKNNKKD